MGKFSALFLAAGMLILAGCGGSGSANNVVPPSNSGSTKSAAGTASSTQTVNPSGSTQTLTGQSVTEANGTTVTENLTVPAGIGISQGEAISAISTTFPVTMSSSSAVTINGTSSGITLSSGVLSGGNAIALPANGKPLAMSVPGPATVGSGSQALTVASGLNVSWTAYDSKSYPSATTYSLPANGGTLWDAALTMTFPAGATGSGTFSITVGGTTYTKTAQVVNGVLSISKISNVNSAIPAGGITLFNVSLNVG